MEIILMHNGKPIYTGSPKVTCDEMADWITQYNLSDTRDNMPPGSSKLMASKALLIISSTLPRALSSLRAIGCEPDIIDNAIREADLPLIRIHGVKLPLTYWIVMWLYGISNSAESLRMAKKRAFKAANILITHTEKSNGTVLLMGHGVMNRLIARELISLGCIKDCCQGRDHWNISIYKLPQVKS